MLITVLFNSQAEEQTVVTDPCSVLSIKEGLFKGQMENIPAIGKSLSGHHILRNPGEKKQPVSQQFQSYHLSVLATGHTHTSSTRTWRASSSYRPCYGPSSPASLSYQTAAAPRRWLHQTPPSDSFASAPSTRCTSPLRLFPRAPWHLPLAPVSPAVGQARSAL